MHGNRPNKNNRDTVGHNKHHPRFGTNVSLSGVNERCFLINDWHKGHICLYLLLILDRKVAFTRIRTGLCGQIAWHF